MTDTLVSSETIEHLDFSPDLPCECFGKDPSGGCRQTADIVVEDLPCRQCGDTGDRWLCSDACWKEMGVYGIYCTECLAVSPRDEGLRYLGRLK